MSTSIGSRGNGCGMDVDWYWIVGLLSSFSGGKVLAQSGFSPQTLV